MITLFCCEFTPFQVCHHSFRTAVDLNKGILDGCHGGDSQDLFSTPELV
jgi:hypothetical protein